MKIYSVTVQGHRHLWTSYQSATQSYGYWDRRYHGQVELETANVPEDAWKPVDRATEEKLNRVAALWDQLVKTDQAGLDALLDDLVRRLQPVGKPVLSCEEKDEAMAALDRLVA